MCTATWIFLGIHHWFTFFCVAAFWGCLFYQMADDVQDSYAIQSLLENPDLFSITAAQGKIAIVGRWEKPIYEDWREE